MVWYTLIDEGVCVGVGTSGERGAFGGGVGGGGGFGIGVGGGPFRFNRLILVGAQRYVKVLEVGGE